jgi:hypothetical protein
MRVYGRYLLLLVSLTVGMMTGCTYYLGELADYIPDPPEPPPQPPEIFEASLSPIQIQAGATAPLTITFKYRDWNGDVGPNSADVELTLTKISGNFNISQPVQRTSGTVQQKGGTYGREGTVVVNKNMNTSSGAEGVIKIDVALFDQAGHKSQQLTAGQITIKPGPGAVLPGGCSFTDANGTPRTSFRVGEQVFFKVQDPDEDVTGGVDMIAWAAAVWTSATADFEPIPNLIETGYRTGTFIGPPAGFLLVGALVGIPSNGQLEVQDGDTIMGQYTDPNDPSDTCIALAKIL